VIDAMGLRSNSENKIQVVQAYVLKQVANGDLLAGQKLPTERQLAQQFDAARYTVRKAMARLEHDGHIIRRIGSGTFVAQGVGSIERDLGDLAHSASPLELIEIRLLFEPGTARLAAARASEADLSQMRRCIKESESSSSWQQCEHWDGELHQAIIRSSRNASLIKIAEFIQSVRQQSKWTALKARTISATQRRSIRQQHRAIVRSIAQRDGDRAERVFRAHLLYVRKVLLGVD
jgi:GntR family transcriptional repressor for pyruvate dehydrogenase complex